MKTVPIVEVESTPPETDWEKGCMVEAEVLVILNSFE